MTRYNTFNLINKHFTRNVDDIMDTLDQNDFAKSIYRERPSIILNFDNEYMTYELMERVSRFYGNSNLERPSRHFFTRFVKDLRQFNLKQIDYCHYSIPMVTQVQDGFVFPSTFMG